MIRCEGFRRSTFVADTGAITRLTTSTGTYQARPSRTGAAGNDVICPATEASGCWVESSTVWVPMEIRRPPAAASSRTVKANRRARSSSANISCPLIVRAASGRRPSRATIV